MKLAILPLLLALNVSATRADLTLAAHGRSDYRIVVSATAIPSERYAAEELQRYLEGISGAKLPLVTDTEQAQPKEIIVGDNQHAQALRSDDEVRRLGPDGFILRSSTDQLLICGGRPRGSLNGVYTFLEDVLRVRWFTPELEVVPKQDQVRIAALNQTRVPALENRDVFWREMMRDANFAAKHRVNGKHYGLQERHGGAFTTYFPFVHSFDLLIPRELFKDHPEYFPEIKGQRKDGYVQRCLSNPDVLVLAIKNVRQWIKEHPEASIISVSQNDTINNCQCAQCKAIDDAEGSPAGSLLQFVNAIAAAIEKESPHIRLDTLAYQYTRKPPKTIRPHRNVIIRLCSIECCFAHPLESCSSEANRRFRDDIIAWQPVAPLLYVWDYTPNFGHYLQPFPNFDSLQANVRFFAEHGVKSLFEQGNYSAGGQGEMGPLRAYVLAKLLWDPNTDVTRHIGEFCQAYFSGAASQIQAYLELAMAQVRGKDCHAHIFDKPTVCYLNDAFLQEAEQLLDAAERAADSADARARVAVARLPVWYVKIATDRIAGEPRQALIQRFLAIARAAKISNISESRTLDDWAKKMVPGP